MLSRNHLNGSAAGWLAVRKYFFSRLELFSRRVNHSISEIDLWLRGKRFVFLCPSLMPLVVTEATNNGRWYLVEIFQASPISLRSFLYEEKDKEESCWESPSKWRSKWLQKHSLGATHISRQLVILAVNSTSRGCLFFCGVRPDWPQPSRLL